VIVFDLNETLLDLSALDPAVARRALSHRDGHQRVPELR
jgi:hypothetical protein